MAGVPPNLQRCGNHQDILSLRDEAGTLILNRCPHGCKTHLSGCDIKGDISIASGDKIYIVPGQKKYKGTVIRPQYGERWFCAELDAIANGWRKAKN